MNRKLALVFTLTLLVGALNLAFNVQWAKASGTIYIRADGSVEGTTDISSVDNVTYTFTDDINDEIIIERDNIVVDGAGYAVQGTGASDSKGLFLSGRSNVTIKNMTVKAFYYGIWLDYSSDNSIVGNNITYGGYGIRLERSSNNTIAGNNATVTSSYGIFLEYSSNNTVSENSVANSYFGIYLLYSCNNNTIFGNNVANNYAAGIDLWDSYNNVISWNNVTNNKYGIGLGESGNNVLRSNSMDNNAYNFGVHGRPSLSVFVNDVDVSNTVDGKPIYYWINEADRTVPVYAGYVALVNCTRITVQNLNLTKNYQGLLLVDTTDSRTTQNCMANNYYGIDVQSSSSNIISGNNITNNDYGIELSYSSNNNTVSGNNIINNNWQGIALYYSSDHNIISGNNIENNNWQGIMLSGSSGNVLRSNSMDNNKYNFRVFGDWLAAFINDVDVSNTVDGKPIYYWINLRDITVPHDAGCIILVNSTNITIKELELKNNGMGLLLAYTRNTTITQNNITNNYDGVYIYHSSNNSIYHNNFVENAQQAYLYESFDNAWDDGYPFGGNYWSDHDGTDSDYDGIGDTLYFIDANNQDNYPLMGMFSSFNTSYGYAVDFISNSSISNFSFDLSPIEVYLPEAILAFNVSGEIDTQGFLRVCIPKILINGSYVIRFDDEIITNTTYPQVRELPCSNETYEYLYINYTHSKHRIEVGGTTTIPELLSFLILPFFMMATLMTIVLFMRRHSVKEISFVS